MRQYTKPSIDLYSVNTEHFLANSRSDNQITGDGNIHTGGNSSESTDEGNDNGSVDDMAKKHYNAWDAWDE